MQNQEGNIVVKAGIIDAKLRFSVYRVDVCYLARVIVIMRLLHYLWSIGSSTLIIALPVNIVFKNNTNITPINTAEFPLSSLWQLFLINLAYVVGIYQYLSLVYAGEPNVYLCWGKTSKHYYSRLSVRKSV